MPQTLLALVGLLVFVVATESVKGRRTVLTDRFLVSDSTGTEVEGKAPTHTAPATVLAETPAAEDTKAVRPTAEV